MKQCAEKILGIADEMRKATDYGDGVRIDMDGKAVVRFADRLAAIAKELSVESEQPGNAARLREALADMVAHDDRVTACDVFRFGHTSCDGKTSAGECWYKIHCDRVFRAKAALSAPVRNCDVGTAREQAVRKAEYCLRYAPFADSNCDACPLRNYNRSQPEREVGYSCDLAWAQLPYDAAQEGGDHADA